MKIVTWNCNGALRKKIERLLKLEADIYIIQECEDPEKTNDSNYRNWADNFFWAGDNKNKGLGIFAKPSIGIQNLNWETNGLKYFISCRVNNDFNLIATWCHGANSPTFGYIGQLWKYLQLNKFKFGKSIIAGDFNSNVIWDKWDRWWNHSDVVRELGELKIESFYHKFFLEDQGKESKSTFYLQKNIKKPYHIDYIFGSTSFTNSIKSLAVGETSKWLELSDHMPVILNL